MSCGAVTDANQLILDLTSDVNFDLPTVDLNGPQFQIPWDADSEAYKNIKPISTADLTTRQVGGDGVFDALMESFSNHLKAEYDKGRITGAEYTKAYIALSEAALGNATQFLLNREQSFWAAQMAQAQAISAKVALEQAKVDLVRVQIQARTQRADYAQAKLRLAVEDVNHCAAKFNLEQILPAQKEQMDAQTEVTVAQKADVIAATALKTDELLTQTKQRDLITAQTANQTAETAAQTYTTSNILPSQKSLLEAQVIGQTKQNDTAQYNLSQTLPAQLQVLQQQKDLVKEQMEAQRSQTLDTRSDNQPVKGSVGKQKDLHTQQIESYKGDMLIKGAKIYSDSWTVQKTIDEGLPPPGSFTSTMIDGVMTSMKDKIGL